MAFVGVLRRVTLDVSPTDYRSNLCCGFARRWDFSPPRASSEVFAFPFLVGRMPVPNLDEMDRTTNLSIEAR